MATLVNACYYALGWFGKKLALPYFTGALAYNCAYNLMPTGSFLSDYLQRWTRDDLATVTRKMSSISCSRLTCAVNFLKRALILASDHANNVRDVDLDRQMDFLQGAELSSYSKKLWEAELTERIVGLLTKSEAWAAEVFFDKFNVDVEGRIEAVKVQFLCALILHKKNQVEVLALWNAILDDVMADPEMMHLIGQNTPPAWSLFSGSVQKNQNHRPTPIRPFFDFIDRLRSTLLNHRHKSADLTLNFAILTLWNTLLTFDPSHDRQVVGEYCILLTVPAHQFCTLPYNRQCTVGQLPDNDGLCLRVLFNDKIERELNLDRRIYRADHFSRCTVAYDPKRESVVLISPNFLTSYDSNMLNDQILARYEFDDVIGYNNKHMLCSQNGVWVMCDEILCKIYVRWYKNSGCQWKSICMDGMDLKKFDSLTIMDVRDVEKPDYRATNPHGESVEILLKINNCSATKFIWSKIDKSDSDVQLSIDQEINVETTPSSSARAMKNIDDCLVSFYSYSSQWMVFEWNDQSPDRANRSHGDTVGLSSRGDTVAPNSQGDTVALSSQRDTVALNSQWDTVVLLRCEEKGSVKLSRLTLDGTVLNEFFVHEISLPDGIRQVACKLPYLFVANKLFT